MLSKGNDIIRAMSPEMYGEFTTSLFVLEDTAYCLQAVRKATDGEPEGILVGTATFRMRPRGRDLAGLAGCREGGGA